MTLNIANVQNAATAGRNKYLDILDAAWQDHLAPRADNAPTVISTFAGGGGSSLGYSMAGYRELLAVEWDDNAVATFKLNFPDVPVYHGDIAKLSVDECLRMAGIQPGELDVFDGSPPCQGFSTAGKRVLDDPRNQLFREYVRLLRGLRPKVFVMENVSGMVKGKMKLVFADIMRELKASGYTVKAALLNAKYFHVPQSRERMIFIGVRDDLGIVPTHPAGQGRPFTVREALVGVAPSDHAPLTELYLRYWKSTAIGDAMGKSQADWRANPDKASNTIRKGGHVAHWDTPRWLAVNEYSILSTFTPNYKWLSRSDALDRIGNSVPPLFMRAIAAHIRDTILGI